MSKGKKAWKITYNTIITISVFFLLLVYANIVLTPKSSSDFGGVNMFQGKGYMSEKENTIDVMMFGNSDLYSGISPMEWYKEYGITGYSSGVLLQSINGIKTLLKQSLTVQSPKVVVLEVDAVFSGNTMAELKSNKFLSLFINPFEYHARWKYLKLRDFYTISDLTKERDDLKGYVYSNKISGFIADDYMGDSSAKAYLPKSNKQDLDEIVSICNNKGIELVFLELPSATSWSYAKHNTINEFAEQNGIDFVDMNIDTKEKYGIDWQYDSRDNGDHLNYYGAKKATDYLGQYLTNKYTMIDHRNDDYYSDWNDSLVVYNRQIGE